MTNTIPELPPIGQVFKPHLIPEQLRAMRRWAPWKAVWNDTRQKYDKIPYHPDHYGLSTKDVKRWVDFDTALATCKLNPTKYSGLGFVLTGITNVVGIDLDNCVKDGVTADWAVDIIDAMGSYTEYSPSGNGIRILATGTFHSDWNNHDVGIEVYAGHAPRFLTITGDEIGYPMNTAETDVLSALHSRYGRGRSTANVIPIQMPELIPDVLLPEIDGMDIPEATKDILRYGPGDTEDRSLALHRTGMQLYSAGYSDAEVLSILADSQPLFDVALSHRRMDEERALQYIWVEHCQKAKPKAVTKDAILADFQDLSSDPEVVQQSKKSEQAQAQREERFRLETTAEFVVRRKASWIIKDVIPNANLGVVYGASGSGKSFFAFEMAAAIARGIEWRGHRTTKSKVCWVAAEGQEDMRKRVAGYCQHHGIEPSELDNLYFVANAPNMMEMADVRALVKQIQIQGQFEVLVMDTLAQVMPGGNENSGEDMGKVLGHCKEITRITGAMVKLIHHSGKDESRGARGWSGLRAACDFEFEVIRADEDRVATVTKMKGGADGEEFGFRLETIVVGQDADGDDETTCVVAHTDGGRQAVVAAREPNGELGKAIVHELTKAGLEPDNTMTRLALVEAVWPTRPRGNSARDQRKTNVNKGLNLIIEQGIVVESTTGVISMASKKPANT